MGYVENLQMIETWVNEWKLTGFHSVVHGGLMAQAWTLGDLKVRVKVEPFGESWRVFKVTTEWTPSSFPLTPMVQEHTETYDELEDALERASAILREYGTGLSG
jgi:hypothetical protein